MVCQQLLGAALPTELRLMLTLALPVGPSWYDWRTDPAGLMDTWREYVTHGLAFDARYSYGTTCGGHDSADNNPVFSVHQTDVIYYGNDLADWFNAEFGIPLPHWAARQPRQVPFWSSLSDPDRWSAPPAWTRDD